MGYKNATHFTKICYSITTSRKNLGLLVEPALSTVFKNLRLSFQLFLDGHLQLTCNIYEIVSFTTSLNLEKGNIIMFFYCSHELIFYFGHFIIFYFD